MGKANFIFLILNTILFVAVLLMFDAQGAGILVRGSWTYESLVSVLLTTVTIVLAFIGLIVAGAAIWGYQSMRSVAEKKAEETSKSSCDGYLQSPVFLELVASAIRDQLSKEARTAVQDALTPVILKSDVASEFQEPGHEALPINATETKPSGDTPWQD